MSASWATSGRCNTATCSARPSASAPPYVDALSVTQVLALRSLRKKVDKEELTHGQKENYTYLILCTVSGVAAGLQNTG